MSVYISSLSSSTFTLAGATAGSAFLVSTCPMAPESGEHTQIG